MNVARVDVETMLQRAGAVLARLPMTGYHTGLVVSDWAVAPDPRAAYGYNPTKVPRLPPTAYEISLMDFVLPWLSYIPDDKYVVRRVVALRMLWDDDRNRAIHPWRKIGELLRCSHVAARSWQVTGVNTIFCHITKSLPTSERIALYMVD